MADDHLATSAENECLLAAITAARDAELSVRRHRHMTDGCPKFGRLMVGAESGAFDDRELVHLGEECRYCQITLELVFAEACPLAALVDQARRGALRGAVEAHVAMCDRCVQRAAAAERSPTASHRRLHPGRGSLAVCGGALAVLASLGIASSDASHAMTYGAAVAALVVAGAGLALAARGGLVPTINAREAMRNWRDGDPTRRLGTWLVLSGVAVAVVGVQSRSLGLRWSSSEVGLGLASCVVGCYMGAARDPLAVDHPHSRAHRGALALAILTVGALAGITSWRFRPHGSEELASALARLSMAGGASLAGLACILGFAGVALRRAHVRLGPQDQRTQSSIAAVATEHPRSRLTQGSIGACGAACIFYAAAHAVVGMTIVPNLAMRVTSLAAAALLALAGTESFHRSLAYRRIVFSWVRWGVIEVEDTGALTEAESPQSPMRRVWEQRRQTGTEGNEVVASRPSRRQGRGRL